MNVSCLTTASVITSLNGITVEVIDFTEDVASYCENPLNKVERTGQVVKMN